MLKPQELYDALISQGVSFFAGVPDSLLKDFCAYVTDHTPPERNVITSNEGSAVALVAGYHLATSEVGLVYMQNSGLGNAVNPLSSLADPEVYAIPMLLVIGWRGEPGKKKDEPQHVKIGRVQNDLLAALEVPFAVLPKELDAARAAVETAVATLRERSTPYALVVQAGTFDRYRLETLRETTFPMSREEAIGVAADGIGPDAFVVSTTGMASRELFEHRVRNSQDRSTDFLTVGSMGHASQIALGVALSRRDRQVYCLDGDGAVLMHMGGLATLGALAPANFKHVVLNNGAHDSVGGQPTAGLDIDLPAIFRACGYRAALRAETRDELLRALKELGAIKGPAMVEVRVRKGARADLGRPTSTPRESKEHFMRRLSR